MPTQAKRLYVAAQCIIAIYCICGCGQIAHGFDVSKCGRSSRALWHDLHMQTRVLRCTHLHPLLACDSIARTFPRQQQKLRLGGRALRWRKLPSTHILPAAGFRISQSGGLEPPHPPPPLRSNEHTQIQSEEKRVERHGVLKNRRKKQACG